MNLRLLYFFVFLLSVLMASAQDNSIIIHSISQDRQPEGENGYTLDGFYMDESARPKLLNTANFGETGIYPRSIEIFDQYDTSGDLASISLFPEIDLFYFGSFNIPDFPDNPFTSEEIDSLYNWSVNGGKMIIAASSSAPEVGIDFRILNEKWGFAIEGILGPDDPTQNNPTAAGMALFNGPFGEVASTEQGGFGQGYFSDIPENAVVMAINQFDQPVIILDCNTLDLILADGDTHNDLSGMSPGADISNAQDQFWGNTVAFMDQLEDPPFVEQFGDTLSVDNNYNSYQWLLDGLPISGATAPDFVPSETGSYSVTVVLDEGCELTSPPFDLTISTADDIRGLSNITLFPNPATNSSTLKLDVDHQLIAEIDLWDISGRWIKSIGKDMALYTGNQQIDINTSDLQAGVYQLVIQSANGRVGELLVVH